MILKIMTLENIVGKGENGDNHITLENIVGKGENGGNQHFLLFPWCFPPVPKQI